MPHHAIQLRIAREASMPTAKDSIFSSFFFSFKSSAKKQNKRAYIAKIYDELQKTTTKVET